MVLLPGINQNGPGGHQHPIQQQHHHHQQQQHHHQQQQHHHHQQQQHHHHHQQQQQMQPQHALKRRPSEEMGGPGSKKFILAGPWDLEIPTNIILFERQPTMLNHPHPDVEVLRFTFLMKLRQSYQEMCHSREGIDAPKDSFNR